MKKLLAVAFMTVLVRPPVARSVPVDPIRYVDLNFKTDRVFCGANVPFGMVMFGGWAESGGVGSGTRLSLTSLSGAHMGSDNSGHGRIAAISGSFTAAQAQDVRFPKRAQPGSMPGYAILAMPSPSGRQVQTELTATSRVGYARCTFPGGDRGSIVVSTNADGSLEATSAGEVRGWSRTHWKGDTVFFFCKPRVRPQSVGIIRGDGSMSAGSFVSGRDAAIALEFDVGSSDLVVEMKVAMSLVSIDNAAANMETELPGWNFTETKNRAVGIWREYLSRIAVESTDSTALRAFYSALYRSLFQPNILSDCDGRYRGMDKAVHTDPDHMMYGNISGWDIYRSWSPLIGWICPREMSDICESLVTNAKQGGGALPTWSVRSYNTPTMGGDPCPAIIAGAYAFGARAFDASAALGAMLRGATDQNAKCGSVYVRGKDLAVQDELGYVPNRASMTLEYANADFCIARMAKALGDGTTHAGFLERAQRWENIFNPSTGYVQSRDASGAWVDGGFVEGNQHQYTWMVPFNHRSLFEKIGGTAAVVARADKFFTNLYGEESPGEYCGLGNEPSFGTPWLYNWAQMPWKTQALLRRAMREKFLTALPGDDDLGSMSSWVVWAMLGFYPSISGVAGLSINGPVFPKVEVTMAGGSKLIIEGEGAGMSAPYIQALTVNGREWRSTWLPLSELSEPSNTVRFTMSATPNESWGNRPRDAPPSFDGNPSSTPAAERGTAVPNVARPVVGPLQVWTLDGRLLPAETGMENRGGAAVAGQVLIVKGGKWGDASARRALVPEVGPAQR